MSYMFLSPIFVLHHIIYGSYGGFLKWGYPQSSSILVWEFPLIINHPANLGIPHGHGNPHITLFFFFPRDRLKLEELCLPELKAMTDVCRDRSGLQELHFHLGWQATTPLAIQPWITADLTNNHGDKSEGVHVLTNMSWFFCQIDQEKCMYRVMQLDIIGYHQGKQQI